MPLTAAQLRDLLQKPRNRATITTAAAHERRLRLHAETTLTAGSNRAVTEFLQWVDSLIPQDKAAIFKALFRYPVKSVSLTDQIFEALEKVFDGRNPVWQVEFRSPEAEADANRFFNETDFHDRWRFESFERMKTAINSVLVCDLPAEQSGSRPEPYFYFLDIEKVIDFDADGDEIEWIAFEPEKDKIAFFDREAFQVFTREDDQIRDEATVPHDLGYCPAQFFWTTPVNVRELALKKSPLSNELTLLDWYLFHAISKQHLDMYASYPIYWGYEQDCDYEDTRTGYRCEGGFLKNDENTYLLDRTNGSLMTCPVCSKSRLNGAGSYNEVPAPLDRESADLRDPVGVITTDVASLDYNVREHTRLRNEIYTNVTGYGGEPVNDQAINEKQVAASFESRAGVLRKLKKDFDRAEKWLVETICRLRYGDTFTGALIDKGTEFYLFTPQEILAMYTAARDAGLSDQILDMLQDQYYETRYRNNPEQLARVRILCALEPFRHLAKTEVRDLYAAGVATFEEMYLKLNFSSLVDRFERENINVIEFGSEIEFPAKIAAIQKSLESYATEKNQQRGRTESGTDPGAAASAAA